MFDLRLSVTPVTFVPLETCTTHKMALDDAVKYTEESMRHCKEVLSFLKKKQIAEQDYARALQRIQPTLKSPIPQADTKNLIANSHLWRVFQELNEGMNSIADIHVHFKGYLNLMIRRRFLLTCHWVLLIVLDCTWKTLMQ